MPPATPILMSMHLCPAVMIIIPHIGGPILGPGAPTVILASMMPGSVMGDMAICIGPPSVVVKGSATVMFLNRPSVRMLDITAHGGIVMIGIPTVMVGG